MERPGILVLQHYKENRRKCSLEALRGRPGIEFRTIRPAYPNPRLAVDGGIVLALESPVLTRADGAVFAENSAARLIVVDGAWVKVRSVVRNIVPARPGVEVRFRSLPPGIVTAFPRQSKLFDDPEEGLSSLEALAAAFQLLGFPARDLLERYRWKEEFLDHNRELFRAS
jgi:pre-rRNA-processing protein TSR3